MPVTLILTISIVLQFVAAFLALRLIRVTGKGMGWGMVAAAITLMTLRRCVTLFDFLSGGQAPDPITESIALAISVLMAAGIAAIRPLFLSMKRSEETLRETERKLTTLLGNLPGLVYRCRNDRDWTTEFVSKGALSLTGYSPSDLMEGRVHMGRLIHPDDRESVWSRVQTALEEKRPYQLTYRLRPASGEEKWVWEQGQGIFSPSGELLFLEGFVTDITERKQAEEALKENEARLRAIIDHEPECVKLVDRDGNLLEMNPAGLRMIEADSLAQVDGRCDFELVVEEHREAFQQMHERVMRGESVSMIFDIISLKGNRKTMETHETPLQDSSGEIFAALGITRDITERKRMEEALKEAEARLRLALRVGRIGVWDWNMETGQIIWSRGHEELWGMPPGTFKGTYEEFNARLHPEDREGLNRAVAEALSERRTYRHEYRVVWPDGSIHWIDGQGEPFWGEEDKPVRMIGVVIDITARKQAEEEIRRLNQDLERRVAARTAELEAVNKEIESFSYSVSHDLRAPLRAMSGFSRVLLNQYADHLDPQGSDYLQRIDAAGRRMGELIEDLLNLSRITRRSMRKEPLDLSALAQSVAEALRKSEPNRKVNFQIEGPLEAEGDPGLLRIVFENLLGNAWKFTSKRPETTIAFGKFEQEGKRAYFVRDNGAGFDMAYADKLFGAFQRLHSQKEFEGTGIGLATVQRIIHRHGGKIWAEGAAGKGATFYFTLKEADVAKSEY